MLKKVMSHVILPKYIQSIMAGCQRITMSGSHRDKLTSLFNFGITKEQINKCPTKVCDKTIYVISSTHDEYTRRNQLAIEKIQKSKTLGFDTETAVVFNANVNLPISLIQLANEDTVILWRLRSERKFLQEKFPATLKNILQSKDIIKVGTGNDGDINDMYDQYKIICASIFDNQKIAKELGFVKLGLASLTAQLFGWRVSKTQRLSNWEAPRLNRNQIIYGATDAWASLLVYKKLKSIMDELSVNPTELPPAFDTMLQRESALDRSMFCAIDQKLKKKKRRKRKLDLTVNNFDLSSYVDSHTRALTSNKVNKIDANRTDITTNRCDGSTVDDYIQVKNVHPIASYSNTIVEQTSYRYNIPFV